MHLDIALGILITISLGKFLAIKSTWQMIVFGIVVALLPDFDFLFILLKQKNFGGKFAHKHREIAHKPLFFAFLSFLIYFYLGKFLALLFLFCTLAHFLHDSIGIGWGVQWLWPFSKKSFKFFATQDGGFSSYAIASWSPQELEKIAEQKGDANWFKNIYFHPSKIMIIETLGFLIGILALILFF